MKTQSFTVFVLLAVLSIQTVTGVLPPNVPVCHRSDPRISECIVRTVESLIPRLASGNLGGGFQVPSLEPFYIREVSFGEENGLKVSLRDLYIRGASKLRVEKLRANTKDIRFDVLLGLPKLDVYGKYKMIFDFLGSTIKSDGDYFTQFSAAKLKLSMKGHRYLKNGVEFIKFDPFDVKFNRGIVSQLKISNLLGGNKVFGQMVHGLLENNQDFVLRNIYPQIEAGLSRTLTAIANQVVENASYDELFPV